MQGSVCITDAQTFPDIYNLLPAVERQITHADMVIVNKSGMVSAETIEKIHAIIKEKNADAAIYDTDFCKVDMQHAIFEMKNRNKEAEETTNAVSNRALTLVVKGDTPVQPEVLEDLLRSVMPSAYRIKGFAQTTQGCHVGKLYNEKFQYESVERSGADEYCVRFSSWHSVNQPCFRLAAGA